MCWLFALLLIPNLAYGAVGEIGKVKGSGAIERGNDSIAAVDGVGIKMEDTAVTANGKIQIDFLDDTRVDITEHSRLFIDEFVYDPANDKYLKGWMPEQKPRTSLPFILHQADMMAARIEFEKEWLPKFKNGNKVKENFTIKNKKTTKSKALGNLSSPGLKNMLDNL